MNIEKMVGLRERKRTKSRPQTPPLSITRHALPGSTVVRPPLAHAPPQSVRPDPTLLPTAYAKPRHSLQIIIDVTSSPLPSPPCFSQAPLCSLPSRVGRLVRRQQQLGEAARRGRSGEKARADEASTHEGQHQSHHPTHHKQLVKRTTLTSSSCPSRVPPHSARAS